MLDTPMTEQRHARFVALHQADQPLLLVNAWDAASACLWQELGALAIGTSSAAVAWSRGYADGGALPREELLGSLRGIVRVTSVPVTVDLEDGYSGDPQAVAALVAEAVASGAVGINIEDGDGPPSLLAEKIRAIRNALGRTPVFINARTDVYLRGLAFGGAAVAETIERLRLYLDAGADGGFVPGLAAVQDAAAIASAVPIALNLMAVPALPSLAELRNAGVRRISSGPGLFRAAFAAGQQAARSYLDGEFAPMLQATLDYNAMNRLFPAPQA